MMNRTVLSTGSILAALALPGVGMATAATQKPVIGKIVSYAKHPGGGTLTAKAANKTLKLNVDKKTLCGYNTGQAGGPLPGGCAKLGKYKGDHAQLVYSHGVLSLVSVNLKKKP
jgi:hypothetical protein